MNKDDLVFEMFKDDILNRKKLAKLTSNYSDVSRRIINYQIEKYGEQLSDFGESHNDFIEKLNRAHNRHHSGRKKIYYE